MFPIARGGSAGEDDAACGADARGGRLNPSGVQFLRVADEGGAKDIVLFDQDNALAAFGSVERGLHTCGSSADDQDITKGRTLAETVGVGKRGCIAKTRRLADKIFVEHPFFGRTEKGLIIKPGGQSRRSKAQNRPDIERQAWPAVLAFGDKAFIDEHIGGAGIGLCSATFADGDERIWFFNACGHDAAWAVIFEASADKANAVAQQRRRQRVTCLRSKSFTIKAEVYHGNASGPMARHPEISLVTRWRVKTIHARQP